MNLLLQRDLFTEDEHQDTEAIIRKELGETGIDIVVVPDDEVMMGSDRIKSHQGPFRGSLTLAQRLGRKFDYANAANWAPALRSYLVSKDYIFLDAASTLERFQQRDTGSGLWGREALFIRPTSGNKAFSGNVYSTGKFTQEFRFMTVNKNIDPCTLCMVASPIMLGREWRLIFVNNKLVGWSQYMLDGVLSLSGPEQVPSEVLELGSLLAQKDYFLNVFDFVIDIAETSDGLRVLEVNAFETASFYAADLGKVYAKWGEALKA